MTDGLRVLDNLSTPKNETGVVSTCRGGVKWADAYPGEILLLQDRDAEGNKRIYGKAFVVKTEQTSFRNMTDDQVNTNHGVHTRETLFAAMQRAYGPNFNQESPVTILYYKRIE